MLKIRHNTDSRSPFVTRPNLHPDAANARYISFKDLDCDGNAKLVMNLIEEYTADPDQKSPFWDYFLGKRNPKSGPKPDDLFLIHANINQIRELFEECGDDDAQALLTWVEEACC
nr:N(2)-fixation sustaining protein CowN [Ectothiorhodospira variabilis]